MTKVCIKTSIYYNNDGEDSNERYSYRGTTSGSVDEIFVSDNDYDFSYEGLETDLEPPFYVVYATYMSGDTFGSDWNAVIVGAEKEYDKAKELLNEATEASSFGELSNGFYIPWIGYFEHLETLEIEHVSGKRYTRRF